MFSEQLFTTEAMEAVLAEELLISVFWVSVHQAIEAFDQAVVAVLLVHDVK